MPGSSVGALPRSLRRETARNLVPRRTSGRLPLSWPRRGARSQLPGGTLRVEEGNPLPRARTATNGANSTPPTSTTSLSAASSRTSRRDASGAAATTPPPLPTTMTTATKLAQAGQAWAFRSHSTRSPPSSAGRVHHCPGGGPSSYRGRSVRRPRHPGAPNLSSGPALPSSSTGGTTPPTRRGWVFSRSS